MNYRKEHLFKSFLIGSLCAFFATGCQLAAPQPKADTMNIAIDFSNKTGKTIKPLHGINNSRASLDKPMEELREAGIPFVRLHDFGGTYGGNVYVDIPNIFPDFNADENDPASYHFAFTDWYLRTLRASGPEIFFRLGVTIENEWKIESFRIAPPPDPAKWARICEHIVRHYNEGWANGYQLGIRYWEIWNEPENPSMWSGTKEQYFELYRVTSRHLRKCFPELKLGGYASCGFYALNSHKDNKFFQGCLVWFHDFLDMVKKENLPLDFYSWHRYFTDPEILREDSVYIRAELDKRGLTATESIFNEWNYYNEASPTKWDDMKEAPGASVTAATMILLQNLPVDKAMYYDAFPTRRYCGFYYFPSCRVTPTYYVFKAFNRLYALKDEVKVPQTAPEIYLLAASGKTGHAVLAANSGITKRLVCFSFANASGNFKAYLTDDQHTFEQVEFRPGSPVVLKPHSVLLLESSSEAIGQNRNEVQKTDFAGISGQ